MDVKKYQELANKTAMYPSLERMVERQKKYESGDNVKNIYYPALGLAGEAGEVAGKVSKIMRDKMGVLSEEDILDLKKELGDCLWFIAEMATVLDLNLEEILEINIAKLKDRHLRNAICGSGDNR